MISALHSQTFRAGFALREHLADLWAGGKIPVETLYRFEVEVWRLAMQRNGGQVLMKEAREILSRVAQ